MKTNEDEKKIEPEKSDIIFKIAIGICAATFLSVAAYVAFLWIAKALD